MSKLGDAIRRSQRAEPAPIGFAAARPAPKPSMLVGFIGSGKEIEAAREAAAELIVLDSRDRELSSSDVEKLRRAANDLPTGALAKVAGGNTKELREAGLDFLTFDAEATPAAALLDEDMGYVLVLPDSPEEPFLRSLEPLSLEALYLTNAPSPLTVAGQIELNRIGVLTRKPLLCQVPAGIAKDDLQCLRAAGVVGLLVDSASSIAALKETVMALPPRRQRREERPAVALPRGQAPPEEEDDDDDDQ